jgi:hypothetical protein
MDDPSRFPLGIDKEGMWDLTKVPAPFQRTSSFRDFEGMAETEETIKAVKRLIEADCIETDLEADIMANLLYEWQDTVGVLPPKAAQVELAYAVTQVLRVRYWSRTEIDWSMQEKDEELVETEGNNKV